MLKNVNASHAFGHLDAEEPHAAAHDIGSESAEREAHGAYGGVGLVENGAVVVELVVLLHQLVDIVGHERGRVAASGLGHERGEVGQMLYERCFLFVGLDGVVSFDGDA